MTRFAFAMKSGAKEHCKTAILWAWISNGRKRTGAQGKDYLSGRVRTFLEQRVTNYLPEDALPKSRELSSGNIGRST